MHLLQYLLIFVNINTNTTVHYSSLYIDLDLEVIFVKLIKIKNKVKYNCFEN